MTSIARRREHNDSGEYSDASQENEKHNSGEDAPPPESDYDSRGSDSDLSEKDADEQDTERRVDDDEDRSNPQYIPKRGTFYEHDDRTAAGEGESTNTTTSDATVEKKESSADTPTERRRPPRKSEIIDKWSHDKYNENEQVPKSRDELVSIYGYDIRNEDAPPHARRNRRYGRGPNKYTRTWEDEEAYRRQAGAPPTPRKPPALSEFPSLHAAGKRTGPKRPPRPRSKSQPNSNDSLENDSNSSLRRNASIKSPRENQNSKPSPKPAPAKLNVTPKGPVKSGDVRKQNENLPPIENLNITASIGNSGPTQRKVNATFAQQRPVPTAQGKKPAPQPPPQQVQNSAPPAPPPQKVAAPAQPPQTGNNESRGSKRYSSLRQRPLAESYVPAPAQAPSHPTYTEKFPEYSAGSQPPPNHPPANMQQQIMHQVHRNPAVNQSQHGPSPPHQNMPQPHAQQQQVRLGMMEQQLVTHPHQLHNMPPPQPHALGLEASEVSRALNTQKSSRAGQMPPAQGYAPPAMLPAQFMQQGANTVYPGAPMYAQPPPAPYPPPHLYQHQYATQAGGVTYYTPAELEPPAMPRTHRRPTAAIPIVRPSQPERAPNSTENDNIDRIVENMFVRKPWPANSTDSKDKAPSETRASQEPTSKESSQPNSLTSSSISTESRPSAERTEPKEEPKPEEEIIKAPEIKEIVQIDETTPESIPTDA